MNKAILISALAFMTSCAYNQIELTDTHGTATDVGEETSTPTSTTTVSPNVNIPAKLTP